MFDFSREELLRYSRHILMPEIGVEGQEKIRAARVLVVGVGGLGSPAALYLAAAGTGTLGLIDGDVVNLSNLQRQIIHATPDVGRAKVDSAEEKIRALNPDVRVVKHRGFLSGENAAELVSGYDFVIDATDNFPVKFLVNDACVLAGKPFSVGGILRFSGQVTTHVPGSACYRCLFDAPPPEGSTPSCSQAGVLGALAGTLGAIQATEALKFITGAGTLLTNRLLTFDLKTMDFLRLDVPRRADCPLCGNAPTILRAECSADFSASCKNEF